MKRYIAFLRGINVGGHRKIKMADLRENLSKLGLENVRSYIQSGNLVLDSNRKEKEVAGLIRESIQKDFGFEVPTLVLTSETIEHILNNSPFENEADTKNLYFALLHDLPQKENYGRLKAEDYPNENFVITDLCVYLNCGLGAGKAKLSNNIIEQKLKVTATTRNLRTLQKMVELAS